MVHIDPYAYDNVADSISFGRKLREDTGRFPVADEQIVRPFDSNKARGVMRYGIGESKGGH